MRNKRKFLALTMASIMGLSTLAVPTDTVKAEEVTREYVVMAKNDAGYAKVETDYKEEITEEASASEILTENNIAVVELTETEAEKLEKNKNIITVEEDILFEGSGSRDKNKKKKNKDNRDFGKTDETEKKLALKKLRQESKVSVKAEEQWNIDAIHANEQEYTKASEQVKVAVLDTGVRLTNEIDVAGRVNFIEGEENVHPLYEDVSGHGTAVASIIAAKENETGITGVNPDVELYSVKVLDDENKSTLSRVVEGIYWCIENDIDIINMSFGTSVKSEILEQVVKEADEAGILMIAAAGNLGEGNGESTVEYPAAFDEVMAVGAMTPEGTASEMSSKGEEIDLMAPGEDVPVIGYYDEIIKSEGTSMAAPHVTGAASVLWAKDKSKSSDFIRALLNASAVMEENMDGTGNGMVDLSYALSVYDEFAENYEQNEKDTRKFAPENPAEVEVYDETQVEASWLTSDHQNVMTQRAAGKGLSSTEIMVIASGATVPDKSRYAYFNPQDGEKRVFHGQKNYVANYIYVMRMALRCRTNGIKDAINNAVHPCSEGQAEIVRNALSKFFDSDYKIALNGAPDNKKNKACLLVGIASHIAMDAYAHKSCEKVNGVWKEISTDQITVNGKTINLTDYTKYIGNRWDCTSEVANSILDVWAYNTYPDAIEFYQPIHDKSKFRMKKLKTFVVEADYQAFSAYPNWYTNRSVGD